MTGEMVIDGQAGLANCAVAQPRSAPASTPRADATAPRADATAPVAAFQAWLASVDVEALSDRERVDLVAVLERVKGSASATQARATHALRCSRELAAPQDVARSVGAEVALARRESPTLGDRFVGLSRALVTELPETMKALTAGAIGERHAVEVVQQSATLSVEDRAELDRRIAPVLGRLGVRGIGSAARRVAAELDAAAVVRRMEAAARSRRVTVRPAPDGMAYLTVLGPMTEVVGAYASLKSRATAVAGGLCADEAPDGRGAGAVMADTALRLMSGRGPGQVQPVEVHLVMTDRALLGAGDPGRSVFEPARVPGHGSVPAPVARAWLRAGLDAAGSEDGAANATRSDGDGAVATGPGDDGVKATGSDHGVDAARVWVRRLYTSPDGRDLVAMDSRRRLFTGLLRRMLVLRDDVCTTPWCEAPVAHADHTTPARDGGPTSFEAGSGKCARCNLGKEAPGWSSRVLLRAEHQPPPTRAAGRPAGRAPVGPADRAPGRLPNRAPGRPADRAPGGSPGGAPLPGASLARIVEVTTPVGRVYESQPPPLLGWGTAPAAAPAPAPAPTLVAGWGPGHKRPCRRRRQLRSSSANRPLTRRPRLTSHLERELCRLLT